MAWQKIKVRCIFVLVLFKICFAGLPQKSTYNRFLAVTIKTNIKNDLLQRKFRSYCIDFLVSETIMFE